MELSKPKSSSEEYADFVYDEYQRFVQQTKLFQVLIDAVREYWTIGETFLFVEKAADIEPCPAAQKLMDRDEQGDSSAPGKESEFHTPLGGTSDRILEYLQPEHRAAWVQKKSSMLEELKTAGIEFDFYESPESGLLGGVAAEGRAQQAGQEGR